ncbi:MAG TPA: helix-turn-helix domain containing protein [Candidatus Bathyarchaeia archaeon]
MDKQQEQEAKKAMVELMRAGYSWQDASRRVGLETTQSTAYYWLRKYRRQGEEGMVDERHGHVAKMSEAVLQYMKAACTSDPSISSSAIKKQIKEQLSMDISVTHLNRTRAKHGWSRQAGEKKREMPSAIKMEQEDSCW